MAEPVAAPLAPLTVYYNPTPEVALRDSMGFNQPEERQRRILAALTARFAASLRLVSNSDEAPLDALLLVHDELYLTWLRGAHASATAAGDKMLLSAEGALLPQTLYAGDRAALPRLARLLPLYAQVALFARDTMSPVLASTWASASQSANNALLGARALPGPGRPQPRAVVYACNSAPGHHAPREAAAGYCFLNSVALAAAWLAREHGARVAVLDVDAHAGDGTQRVFYSRGDVLTVSLHIDPRVEYPYVYGHADEAGEGAGGGACVNLPLAPRTRWAAYSDALAAALRRMAAFDAPYWLVAFGADTFEGDPDMSNLSGLGLGLGDYEPMGRQVRAAAGDRALLVTAEGGYAMDHVADISANFLAGLMS